MPNWMDYLRSGLSRKLPQDRISGPGGYAGARRNLRYLKPFWARHWRKGLLASGLMLLASLLAFPQPLIYRYLVDSVILAKRLDLLPLAILLWAAVKGLEVAVSTLQRYYFTRFEQEVSLDIQQNVLDHALRLPKAFFDEKEVGYLTARLSSDVQGLRWFFSSSIASIVSSLLTFVGGVIFIIYLEWRLGLATLIALPVLVFTVRYFTNRMRVLSHHTMEQNANVLQRFQETLASIPLVKAFTSEQRESERIMTEVRSSRRIEMEQTVVGSLANLIVGIVPDLARGIVLVAGAYLVIRGEWTFGSLLAFLSYLSYVYSPALTLAYANMQYQNALATLERVSVVFDVVPEDNAGTGVRVEHLKGEVRFEDVSFSYGKENVVLNDVSFTVQPGEHVAIAGPSGVGKTTLMSLMLCFYRPAQGRIYFDGQEAAWYELNGLRQRIGYVAQSTQLLAGTIRENLTYGAPDASQEMVENAAMAAGIHEFILGLPGQYDALVGERGVNLSEGQKQRLSIARALIKDPDILVLDEPTSALDGVTERSIFEVLPALVRHKTLFIISHRVSTLLQADRVLLFKDGRLDASGSHGALMDGNDYYRSLFQQ
jgi:ABC-type bacteriocin/lantibiotic exporter with double-glycine peptidase domain